MHNRLLALWRNLNPRRLGLRRSGDSINYELMGMFVASWARLEISLDYANWTVLHTVQTGDTLTQEMPRSLGNKIDLFKRAHKELPALSDFREDGLALVSRIKSMQESRHDIIHGRGVEKLDSAPAKVMRLQLKSTEIHHLEKNYTREHLIELVSQVNELQYHVSLHIGRLRVRFLS